MSVQEKERKNTGANYMKISPDFWFKEMRIAIHDACYAIESLADSKQSVVEPTDDEGEDSKSQLFIIEFCNFSTSNLRIFTLKLDISSGLNHGFPNIAKSFLFSVSGASSMKRLMKYNTERTQSYSFFYWETVMI